MLNDYFIKQTVSNFNILATGFLRGYRAAGYWEQTGYVIDSFFDRKTQQSDVTFRLLRRKFKNVNKSLSQSFFVYNFYFLINSLTGKLKCNKVYFKIKITSRQSFKIKKIQTWNNPFNHQCKMTNDSLHPRYSANFVMSCIKKD